MTLSRPVEARAFVLERPDRAVIELPDVNCQLPPDGGAARAGPVAGFRCGAAGPGRSRIVVDLATPAVVGRLATEPGPLQGSAILSVEIARTDRDAMRRAAAEPGFDRIDATGSIGPRGQARLPVIVLDAGHGGTDPGAKAGNGLEEKNLTLAFVAGLRERLAATGRFRIVLTREGDVFVPLDERVRIAREAGAALFISIHADSIARPSVRGATIYTGADRATDSESASLAERENAADGAPASPEVDATTVADILQDLTLRETRAFSHRFATLLLDRLGPVIRFSVQPHRQAGFRVLRAPDVPAVLVELGYLSNARDTELMLSDGWRTRSTEAVAEAVMRFFAPVVAARAPVSP
ncbi:MAG: N-acetylmuramoyl-L-alanine amidase [Methylobacteriaceae bacterium]|nr:N-acetylmuramoyl-L-alanine amidase [Methylobacteriaceae bacterium]